MNSTGQTNAETDPPLAAGICGVETPVNAYQMYALAPRMRGTLSATVVIVCNLIGAGLGPQLIGSASDLLRRSGDARPLAHAIGFVALAGFLSSFLFLRARRVSLQTGDDRGPRVT